MVRLGTFASRLQTQEREFSFPLSSSVFGFEGYLDRLKRFRGVGRRAREGTFDRKTAERRSGRVESSELEFACTMESFGLGRATRVTVEYNHRC